MIVYTGTILNFDGQPDKSGDVFDENTEIEFSSNPITITLDFKKEPQFVLGRATLFFSNSSVRYEMKVDDTRLTKDILDQLYPCIGGIVAHREGNNISRTVIDSIGLSESPNQDKRIRPLGEQT